MSVGLLGMWTQQTHRLQSKKNFAKTIKEGQFYRFTFSRQGKVYSMYVDGKLHLQTSSAKYTLPSGAAWVLGQEQDKKYGGFQVSFFFFFCKLEVWGDLSHVRHIYTVFGSECEMQNLYSSLTTWKKVMKFSVNISNM